ncbi:MAG TPA: hypothetical protein VLF71_04260 [Candidatus Saccharimonadales bacterium]|nr:hypothetical protein [Candidatus Saccharimonadales bacterium]
MAEHYEIFITGGMPGGGQGEVSGAAAPQPHGVESPAASTVDPAVDPVREAAAAAAGLAGPEVYVAGSGGAVASFDEAAERLSGSFQGSDSGQAQQQAAAPAITLPEEVSSAPASGHASGTNVAFEQQQRLGYGGSTEFGSPDAWRQKPLED